MNLAFAAAVARKFPLILRVGFAAALLFSVVVVPAPRLRVEAAGLPAGFAEEIVASTFFSNLTGFDFLPNGRLLVVEKDGKVWLVDENDPAAATLVLNISALVNNNGDRGLIGIAVDPAFATTQRIFLAYSYDPPETAAPGPFWNGQGTPTRALANGARDAAGQRVSRVVSYRLNPATGFSTVISGSSVVVMGAASTWSNIGDPFALQTDPVAHWACMTYSSGQTGNAGTPIKDCLPADGISHQIDSIRFGPDGSMYVSMGDSTTSASVDKKALRALDLNQLIGKVVRINPNTGAGLANNPHFDGDAFSNRSRVWMSGLRNPFRFTIDDSNGDVYIGDVGWNRFEEINVGIGGESFGWPCFEGGLSSADIALGVAEGPGVTVAQPGYAALAECAAFPEATQHPPLRTWCHYGVNPGACQSSASGLAALAGDIYTGGSYPAAYEGLWYGDIIAGWIKVLDLDTGQVIDVADSIIAPVELRVGPDGDVYYGTRVTNQIKAIRYTSTNLAPSAAFTTDVSAGLAPLTVSFDASGSFDPDGLITDYAWTFGDGATGSGVSPSHTYTVNGSHIATLTVTDDLDDTAEVSATILVGDEPPIPVIDTPDSNAFYDVDSLVQFSGSATDPQDGAVPPERLVWTAVQRHNDHTHEDAYFGTGPQPPPYVFQDHGDDTFLEVCLTATDSANLSATTCVDMRPTAVNYTFETSPPGLDIVYNGEQLATPVTRLLPANASRDIGVAAPPPGLSFDSWSIGGPPTQSITIATQDTTLVANYVPDIAPGAIRVVEGDDSSMTVEVPITLSAPAVDPVVFEYATSVPTQSWQAEAGTDYEPTSGSITIQPGETSATIPVVIHGDQLDEPSSLILDQTNNDWLFVELSNVVNARLDTTNSLFGRGVVVISDDDPPTGSPGVQLSPGGITAVEGDAGNRTVRIPFTLSTPAAGDVTFSYTTPTYTAEWAATAGLDMIATSGSVTIPAGQRHAYVEVTLLGDDVDEDHVDNFLGSYFEWVFLKITNVTNATLDITNTFFGFGYIAIRDDDPG